MLSHVRPQCGDGIELFVDSTAVEKICVTGWKVTSDNRGLSPNEGQMRESLGNEVSRELDV